MQSKFQLKFKTIAQRLIVCGLVTALYACSGGGNSGGGSGLGDAGVGNPPINNQTPPDNSSPTPPPTPTVTIAGVFAVTGFTRVVGNTRYNYSAAAPNLTATNYFWSWADVSATAVVNPVEKIWYKPGVFTNSVGATINKSSVSATFTVTVVGEPVSGGRYHNCALQTSGSVLCWGTNEAGQLGDGTLTDKPNPVAVLGLTNAVAVSAGGQYACALKTTGSVVCWGSNQYGELGDGTLVGKSAPVAVSGLTDAIALSAGDTHACALRASGAVACWGTNGLVGQLGNATAGATQSRPVSVIGLSDAIAISVGKFGHSCALRANGTVFCWGYDGSTEHYNASGQLSSGPITDTVAISSGYFHTCALKTAGAVVCWGNNDWGQLGNTTTVKNSVAPVTVTGLSNAVALKSGAQHTCALKATGEVVCWGIAGNNILGDGVAVGFSNTPVIVANLTNAVALGAGHSHNCALTSTGTVRCWGYGPLGRETTGSSLASPVTGGDVFWK
jgi:alpha-tubulin suppressor-like RCC1 family protein